MENLSNDARNDMGDAFVDALDSGAGDPVAELQTAASAVLMSITLNATAAFGDFGAVTPGIGSMNNPQTGGGDWASFSQLPTVAGVIAKVVLKDGDGTIRGQMTVSTIAAGTGEWQFTTLNATTDVPITMTAAPTLTVPESL